MSQDTVTSSMSISLTSPQAPEDDDGQQIDLKTDYVDSRQFQPGRVKHQDNNKHLESTTDEDEDDDDDQDVDEELKRNNKKKFKQAKHHHHHHGDLILSGLELLKTNKILCDVTLVAQSK